MALSVQSYVKEPVTGKYTLRLLRYLVDRQESGPSPLKDIVNYVYAGEESGGARTAEAAIRQYLHRLRPNLKTGVTIVTFNKRGLLLVDRRSHVHELKVAVQELTRCCAHLSKAVFDLQETVHSLTKED